MHSRRSGVSGAAYPCGRAGVNVAQQQPAGLFAIGGLQRLVANRRGGSSRKDDPLDPVGADHGSSQVGQPGTGAVPGRHRIVSARVRSNGAAQPG